MAPHQVVSRLAKEEYHKQRGVTYNADWENPNRAIEYRFIYDAILAKIGSQHVDATGYPIVAGDKLAVAVSQGDTCALRIGVVKTVSDKGVQLELEDGGRKQTYKFFERMVVVR